MTTEVKKVIIIDYPPTYSNYQTVRVDNPDVAGLPMEQLTLHYNWKIPKPKPGQIGYAKINHVQKGDSYITPEGVRGQYRYAENYLIDFIPV